MQFSSGVTEALKKHLKGSHPAIAKEVEDDTKKRKQERDLEKQENDKKRRKLGIGTFKSGDVPASQPTITSTLNKLSKVDPNGVVQKKYDDALVELIACNFLSFNLVESPEFKSFVSLLNSAINLKDRTTYSRMTGRYSDEILNEVRKMIEEFTDASIATTTDIWTSRTMDSYISLTVHFVDKLFRIHRYVFVLILFHLFYTNLM